MTNDELVSLMSSLGTLKSPGRGAESAPVVIEYRDPQSAETGTVQILAWITTRADGAQVLILAMRLGLTTAAGFAIDRFASWAASYNPRSLFGTIDIERHGEEGLGTAMITVRHALPAACISAEGVNTILSTMNRTRSRCESEVLRLDRQRRREEFDDCFRGDQGAARAELNDLVGLLPVKKMINRLSAQQHIAALRERAGLKAVTTSPHLVFTGNPGTGKTTVAKLIGRLYHDLGLLSKGHVVEVDRGGLVAGYIGQTALKTSQACDAAAGGVLFIDEAYALTGTARDFGHEAVETLLTCMEARRGDMVVIAAGYSSPMSEFLSSNPGLASRFDHTIHFPDYTDSELLHIFDGLVRDHDYTVTESARLLVGEHIASLPRHEGFGNAREIRRLFNEVVCNHAELLSRVAHPSTEQLRVIPPSAIPAVERSAASDEGQQNTNRWFTAGYL